MTSEKVQVLMSIFPLIAVIVSVTMAAWVFNTWLRIKNGYPLETSWGKPIYPQKNAEVAERVTLLSQENAQLRAELGSVKDRLANVERIVTDGSHDLSSRIDALREPRLSN